MGALDRLRGRGSYRSRLLDAGRNGLAQGWRRRSASESESEAQTEELKVAQDEAHVQPRVWKKGAGNLPPLRSSRRSEPISR